MVNFENYDVTTWLTNNYNAYIAHISQSNGNQIMKFGWITEHDNKKFSSKITQKMRQGD